MSIEKNLATKANPLNLAASWYIALRSNKLGKKPIPVELFGQDLVAWRDQNGQAVLMERHCCHLGASLAGGKVQDGCIECPFHGWRFNKQGQCVVAPDVDVIPKTAWQKTYPVQEKYGYIWAWYGSPEPLFPLFDFPAAEGEKKKHRLIYFSFLTRTTARRVLENTYDPEHLKTAHGLPAEGKVSFTMKDTIVNYTAGLPTEARLGAKTEAKLRRYVGPVGLLARFLGLNSSKFRLDLESCPSGHLITLSLNDKPRFVSIVTVTPLAEMKSVEHALLAVKKTGNFGGDLAALVLFGFQTYLSAKQDVPIWDNLKPDGGGVFVKNDLGMLKFREFYQEWVRRVV
jgi:aminopyrrolnitrin oxygenase